jgi:kynurenine formamidase
MPDETQIHPKEEVLGYLQSLSNWGRWGNEDELGTLNLITPAKMVQALSSVRTGEVVSCGRVIEYAPKAPSVEAPIPPLHFMTRSGEAAGEGESSAHDWVGLPLHGLHITHLDAHSHIFYNAKMYNGRDAQQVMTATGARKGGIDLANKGIISRGVFFDIPAAREVPWLADDDAVTAADLDKAESLHGFRAEPGDVVLIRTGYGRQRQESPPAHDGAWKAESVKATGLDADTLPWLRQRDVAALVTDCGTDRLPSPDKTLRSPVHTVSIVAMGMWIIDNADFEGLARACQSNGRHHFLFLSVPVRLKNATGSPVNPLAVF